MNKSEKRKSENTITIRSLPPLGCRRWCWWVRRVMLLDRLVEGRYCLPHERCPSFNWKEDALESWIILILKVTFGLQTHVPFSVNRHELCTHVGKLSIMDFEILKSVNSSCLF